MTGPDTVPRGLPVERDAGPFNPPQRLARLRDTRPVSPLEFPDGHRGVLVTGHDEVRAVLADTRFSSRLDLGVVHEPFDLPGLPTPTAPPPPIPGMFIAMDPPEHPRLRRRLAGAFTARRTAALEEHVADVVERRLDDLERTGPPVDLVARFALPVPSLVIGELLGVPDGDLPHFQAHAARFLVRDQSLEEKGAAYGALTAYLGDLVAGKRAGPRDDLLSDLARQDDLTVDELVGCAFLLLLAGHETTANMLALGTFALLEHPEQAALLRGGDVLPAPALDELERFLSVVDLVYRYATDDLELGGTTVPRGSTVVLSLLAANHDPRRFTDPDALDLRRPGPGHLTFGHGVHHCLGRQLARVEMRAGFSGLLRRLPGLALAVPSADVALRSDMNVYGVHALPVTWTGSAVQSRQNSLPSGSATTT